MAKGKFVVFHSRHRRGQQYLFEHEGRFAWGPKRLATVYTGRVSAERAAIFTGFSRGRRAKVVRA